MGVCRVGGVGGCESDGVGGGADEAAVGGAIDQEGVQGGVSLDAGTHDPAGQQCAKERDCNARGAHVPDGARSIVVVVVPGLLHAERVQHAVTDAGLDGGAGGGGDHLAGQEVPDVGVGGPGAHGTLGGAVLGDDPGQESRVGRLVGGPDPPNRERVAEPGRVAQQLAGRGVAVRGVCPVVGQVGADGCVDVEDSFGMQPHGRGGGGDLRHGEPRVLVVDGRGPTAFAGPRSRLRRRTATGPGWRWRPTSRGSCRRQRRLP